MIKRRRGFEPIVDRVRRPKLGRPPPVVQRDEIERVWPEPGAIVRIFLEARRLPR